MTDKISVDPAPPTPEQTFKQTHVDVFKNAALKKGRVGGVWIGDIKSGVPFAILIIDLPPQF